jgi:hypothetical protein
MLVPVELAIPNALSRTLPSRLHGLSHSHRHPTSLDARVIVVRARALRSDPEHCRAQGRQDFFRRHGVVVIESDTTVDVVPSHNTPDAGRGWGADSRHSAGAACDRCEEQGICIQPQLVSFIRDRERLSTMEPQSVPGRRKNAADKHSRFVRSSCNCESPVIADLGGDLNAHNPTGRRDEVGELELAKQVVVHDPQPLAFKDPDEHARSIVCSSREVLRPACRNDAIATNKLSHDTPGRLDSNGKRTDPHVAHGFPAY